MRWSIAGIVVCLIVATGSAQRPAPAPPLRSPELSADRHATFRILAPKASEVLLRGDFLSARMPMQKDERGIWTVTVGPVKPDIYTYEFIVDGVRVLDPVNPSMKYSSRPSEASSQLEVPDERPMFYDARKVAHGTVQVRWYSSKSLDSERRMYIYTPPNYEHATVRYPVLYLLHGAGGDDGVWVNLGHANLIFDNLIADRKLSPLVVVMPFGYGADPNAPGSNEPEQRERQGAGFVRDLIEDVIPYVQANYRVDTDREHRAIAGLSMGGGQALNIGMHHLELFSRVAGFSAGFLSGSFKQSFQDVVAQPQKMNSQLKLLWIGCGTEDRLFTSNQEFSGVLKSNGIKHTFRSSEGNHTWQVWRRYLYEVAPLIFPKAA